MITYKDLDEMGQRCVGLSFTMVFEDGERITDCHHENVDASDAEVIEACNRTNPARWGRVVAIADRRNAFYWKKRD